MKKTVKTVFALLLLMVVLPSQAQISWGIKGGLNVANAEDYSGKNAMDKDSYTGFYIGPKLDIGLLGNLGVNGALLYSQEGMKLEDSKEKIDLNSLEIPVNLTYRLLGGETLGVFVEAGPQFGFNIGSKKKEMKDGVYNLESSTLSLNLGVGVELFNFLQVAVNYNIPMGKTAEFNFDDAAEEDYSTKMKTVQISASIMF